MSKKPNIANNDANHNWSKGFKLTLNNLFHRKEKESKKDKKNTINVYKIITVNSPNSQNLNNSKQKEIKGKKLSSKFPLSLKSSNRLRKANNEKFICNRNKDCDSQIKNQNDASLSIDNLQMSIPDEDTTIQDLSKRV